jgi:hypothetical protein
MKSQDPGTEKEGERPYVIRRANWSECTWNTNHNHLKKEKKEIERFEEISRTTGLSG